LRLIVAACAATDTRLSAHAVRTLRKRLVATFNLLLLLGTG
jgi:hypothetical protein